MTDQTVYSLWLQPEGEIYDQLSQLIIKLSKEYQSPIIKPHITLLGGLKMNEGAIIEKLKYIASKPVRIQLGEIGYKDNLFQSFFIHVANDEIYSLRKQCEPIFNKSDAYMPHLSLMYHEIPRQEKEKLAEGLGNFSGAEFTAHKIHLISTAGNPEQWTEVASISL